MAKRVEVDDYEDAIDAIDLDMDDNYDIPGGGDEVAEVPCPFILNPMSDLEEVVYLGILVTSRILKKKIYGINGSVSLNR